MGKTMTMPREELIEGELIKAVQNLETTLVFLRVALRFANGVESILILQLIEDAAKLNNRISHLRDAI